MKKDLGCSSYFHRSKVHRPFSLSMVFHSISIPSQVPNLKEHSHRGKHVLFCFSPVFISFVIFAVYFCRLHTIKTKAYIHKI